MSSIEPAWLAPWSPSTASDTNHVILHVEKEREREREREGGPVLVGRAFSESVEVTKSRLKVATDPIELEDPRQADG